MHSDRSVLSELLLSFVHLPQEVYEAISTLGHTLLRPVCELELAYRARRTVAGIRYL